jgi:peptide/nickel transport system permease protein
VIRRLALAPITLVGITLATFALVHLAPGDAALVQGGTSATSESIAALRHQLKLDRPLPEQYASWLWRSLKLDFGDSLSDGRPVRDKLAEALPVTLELALLGTCIAFGVGVPLGVALGMFDRRRGARAAAGVLDLLYALPLAAVALLLLQAGAPFGGRSLRTLLPAAACLALAETVKLARYQRAALLDALAAGYITTARAKGAGARAVARHALANALLPTVTLLGAELPALLSSSVIVEQVFGIPGLGWLGFDALLRRDLPLLLALTTLGALVTLVAVLAADLSYGLIDPRLRGRAA